MPGRGSGLSRTKHKRPFTFRGSMIAWILTFMTTFNLTFRETARTATNLWCGLPYGEWKKIYEYGAGSANTCSTT